VCSLSIGSVFGRTSLLDGGEGLTSHLYTPGKPADTSELSSPSMGRGALTEGQSS